MCCDALVRIVVVVSHRRRSVSALAFRIDLKIAGPGNGPPSRTEPQLLLSTRDEECNLQSWYNTNWLMFRWAV